MYLFHVKYEIHLYVVATVRVPYLFHVKYETHIVYIEKKKTRETERREKTSIIATVPEK